MAFFCAAVVCQLYTKLSQRQSKTLGGSVCSVNSAKQQGNPLPGAD